MHPVDWDEPNHEDPTAYMRRLLDWEIERDRLEGVQQAASDALVDAEARRRQLQEWADGMGRFAETMGVEAGQLQSVDVSLRAAETDLERIGGELADHTEARRLATTRLLGGPQAEVPLVLLPLRLETRWADEALHVRIYPDDIAVDGHDPGLTDDEITWARHFWDVRAGTVDGEADPEETWQQLVRRFGPGRAAWLVRATAPGQPAPKPRPDPWPRPALARLLPDRFAIVALAGGLPVNLAPAGSPPRYVTWSTQVADPLPIAPLDDGKDELGAPWWSDLSAARLAGMAVTIPLGKATPTIEALAVVGIRGGRKGDPAGTALAKLFDAHSVSGGAELLADGTATNNSSALRSAFGPVGQERAARSVRDSVLDGTTVVHPHSAGAQLADLLGLPPAAVAPLAGADTDRHTVTDAARLLVGLGSQGNLRGQLDPFGDGTWTQLEPAGPAPVVRVGRQPYGVLPATAPGRWVGQDGETGGKLADALHQWATATGPPVFVDPGSGPKPLGGGPARHATNDDDSELADLLVEAAASQRWAAADGGTVAVDGPDALVGPAEGDASAAAVLPVIAATAPADLPSLPASVRTASLLARIAVAAKTAAAAAGAKDGVDAVDAALATLAAAAHAELARVVAELLDAASHRFDSWITAVATERLTAFRHDHPGEVAVGAFGWLTDVAPRELPRSFGHVHAPSMAQAATAAVLRSGFLGQRRRAWASMIEQAELVVNLAELELSLVSESAPVGERQAREAQLAAALAHLDQARFDADRLLPLDAAVEANLPLAIDLSSHRVRGARSVLAAVRAGQPLAAVLGYRFERDLADAGLQQFLGAFRKLTRFHTGTALEQVEQARRDRRAELTEARRTLAGLQQNAANLLGPLQQARAAEQAASSRVTRADAAFAPFQAMRSERATKAERIATLRDQLDALNRSRPKAPRRHFTINIP